MSDTIFARATFGLGSAINLRLESGSVKDKRKNLRASIGSFCILVGAFAQTAFADDGDAALQCRDVVSADARLACFDAAYATQEKPSSSALETAIVAPAASAASAPPPAVKSATEEQFGLPQSQIETLTSVITSVDKDAVGRLTFHLENGQTWKQIETRRFRITGDRPVAVIKHAALGSFKLSVEGEARATRVKRLQ